jgi:pimeloyl-ACP methyl ester carboxylesterase
MTTLYCISGIGADERVFHRLNIPGVVLQHIKWIPPEKNDTISSYATKLLPQIKEPNPLLLGVSFGGMVAVEMSKLIPTRNIILVSSSKTLYEIPFYYRWYGRMGLYRLLSPQVLKLHNRLSNVVFSIKSKEEKLLLKTIMKDTDPAFLKWAVKAICTWRNEVAPNNTVHIHGTADKMLPARYVQPTQWIEKAGHFMIHSQAAEISRFIADMLKVGNL